MHAWRLFSRAYPSEDSVGDHILRITNPELPLPRYLNSLNEPCAHWTTFLHISNVPFPDSEYAHIANLDNLVGLDLCCRESEEKTPLHFLLVRRLSEQARLNGKLARLAIMIFRGKTSFDERLFRRLSAFPALKHCVLPSMSIPNIEHLARSNGWERETYLGHWAYIAWLTSLLKQPKHARMLHLKLGPPHDGWQGYTLICLTREAVHKEPEQVRLAADHCEGQVMEAQSAPQGPPKPRNRALRSSKCRSMDCMLKEYEDLS